MIRNLPDSKVFKALAIENIVFALNMVIEKEFLLEEFFPTSFSRSFDPFRNTSYSEIFEQKAKEEAEQNKKEKNEFMKKMNVLKRTSLLLLFQGIENYLKYKVCEISPLLLLSTPPEKWRNKDFNDLRIHQFDDLLAIFLEQDKINFLSSQKNDFKILKKRRNEITHGVPQDNITYEYIFECLYIFVMGLWDKNEWWREYKEEKSSIIYNYTEEGSDETIYYSDFPVFKKYLAPDKLKKLFNENILKNEAYCPSCVSALMRFDMIDEPEQTEKHAYYISENKITCPVCEQEFEIEKGKCEDSDCKQAVYYEDVDFCLSCGIDREI